MRVVKSRTTCAACGRFGHWQGDPECTKSGGKSKGKTKGRDAGSSASTTATSYFVVADDIGFDGISDAYVAGFTPRETALEPGSLCRCCQGGLVRGANGHHRWVDCRVCRDRVHTAYRSGKEAGRGLWIYFMLNLVLQPDSVRIWFRSFRQRLERLSWHGLAQPRGG